MWYLWGRRVRPGMESSIEMMLQKELFSVCFFNICSSDQKGKTRGDELWGAEKENYMQIFTRISSWSFRYILQGRHRLNLINCLSLHWKLGNKKFLEKKLSSRLSSECVTCVREVETPSFYFKLSTIALKPCSENLYICYLLSQSQFK